MRAKYVNENIEFERGRDPRKAMDVGVAVENRDIFQMEKNFKEAFPEVTHTHTSTSYLHSPGENPIWKQISIALANPKDNLSVDERKKIFMDWFNAYTDYDIIRVENAHDRKWHPWGDESNPGQYEQSFIIQMRNKEDVK